MLAVGGRELQGEVGWSHRSSRSSWRQTNRSANQPSADLSRLVGSGPYFSASGLFLTLPPLASITALSMSAWIRLACLINHVWLLVMAVHLFWIDHSRDSIPWRHHTGTGAGPVCSDPTPCRPEPRGSRRHRSSSQPDSAGWSRWGSSPTRSEGTMTKHARKLSGLPPRHVCTWKSPLSPDR